MPVALHPTAPLAERVLLPGDPGRALRLAQVLIDGPKMFNHNRGLWGYSGPALADGEPLTIQSTGIGGPSAAIVVAELADLGACTLLRVGTCAAIAPGLELGALFLVTEAICADGTSRALGAGARVGPAPALTAAVRSAGEGELHAGIAVSTDLFPNRPSDVDAGWAAAGAAVVEMEAAALFTLGAQRGLSTGAVLIVSEIALAERRRIEELALHDSEQRLGQIAIGALAAG